MKKYLYIAFTILVVAMLASLLIDSKDKPVSQTTTPTMPVFSAQANTFLWKIEKESEPVSFLLGSIHIGKIDSQLPQHIQMALSQSDTLMTEVNMSSKNNDLLSVTMYMLDMNNSLKQNIGGERFNQIASLIDPSIGVSGLDKFKPWAALTLIMYAKPDGYSELFGIDILLTEQAEIDGKKLVNLESYIEALDYFAKLPEYKILSLMDIFISNKDEIKRQMKQLSDMYVNNQADQLAYMLTDKDEVLKYYPEEDAHFWSKWFYDTLLAERNEKWLVKIIQILPQEATLITVGAAHLYGETGLIQQIRNQGYQVTPVMPEKS